MSDEVINKNRREFLTVSGQVLPCIVASGAVIAALSGTASAVYDRPQFVTPAAAKLAAFFGRHLART